MGVDTNDLRYKFDLIYKQGTDAARLQMLYSLVGDIVLYLEQVPMRTEYLPEPRLGPKPQSIEVDQAQVDRIVEAVRSFRRCPICQTGYPEGDWPQSACGRGACPALEKIPPVDKTAIVLTDGSPVTEDHRDIDPATGMKKGYIVLTAEERAKGFVRPVRRSYKHIGARPKYPLRDLTEEEKQRHAANDYVSFEPYPDSESPVTGRFWTQKQLKSGCQGTTTMSLPLAETYARDPGFYGGTFCSTCHEHFPLNEFVWQGTTERVGS